MKTLAVVALSALLAVPAFAGMATSATESGSNYTTGGRGTSESYGLSQLLMESNNHFVAGLAAPLFLGGRGGLCDYTGDENVNPLGILLHGQGGTLFTYDQLAYMPVLQILGYDPQTSGGGVGIPSNGASQANLRYFGPSPLMSESEGTGRSARNGGGGYSEEYLAYLRSLQNGGNAPTMGGSGGGGGNNNNSVAIPEPATLSIMALSAVWMLQRRRRQTA